MFIEILLKLINERGITKTKFLNDVGLNKSCILNWQQRGTIPNGEVLTLIANYFDVSTDYLLGKTDERKKPSPEPVLTEREKAILEIFRSLSEEKQDKLIEILENM